MVIGPDGARYDKLPSSPRARRAQQIALNVTVPSGARTVKFS
jgi:hypothetical protein